ncbi:hypothetical protein NON08_03085 [Cetobacterium somerae]|uniref:hypothetical protein n=1 Tax=Cetobacterium sp. NK01 TaxID=2993530 RepID=UPI0021163940|nr:hypothetical protein [Cetobacterium sp. NK01]MCQ8211554.1 hypothetical protein [Cetobacterium sp. NK01]
MKRIKWLLSFKNIYMILLIYFFLGYFYPNFLQINNIYLYIQEYLGIYEKLLWVFLIGYGFSMCMQNPNKRIVLKTRLFFMVILGVATGYLYLLDNLKNLGEISLEKVQEFVIQVGLLNINLGYIELYTFLKIFSRIRVDVFTGILIFVIFISLIIICGKMVRGLIMTIVNLFKKYIIHIKEERRLKEERIRLEKQAKLEKDIYDEICNIQKIYEEKEKGNILEESMIDEEKITEEESDNQISETIYKEEITTLEMITFKEVFEKENDNKEVHEEEKIEGKDEDNDISIQISEEKRDINTSGISITN